MARCPAGKTSIRRHAVRGQDPGFTYAFSRRHCRPCPFRARCTKSRDAARALRITAKTEQLRKLRRRQKTKRFRERYRRRVVVEDRIGRLVQLGVPQARYLGRRKVSFQVALLATVANLTLLTGLSALDADGASLAVLLLAATALAFGVFQVFDAQSRPDLSVPSP